MKGEPAEIFKSSPGQGRLRVANFAMNYARRGTTLRMAADASAGPIKGDENKFIDNITGQRTENDNKPNFSNHNGLEDHCFFALQRHA